MTCNRSYLENLSAGPEKNARVRLSMLFLMLYRRAQARAVQMDAPINAFTLEWLRRFLRLPPNPWSGSTPVYAGTLFGTDVDRDYSGSLSNLQELMAIMDYTPVTDSQDPDVICDEAILAAWDTGGGDSYVPAY